jgi:hypothetical protein
MRLALRAVILALTVLTGCNDEPAQRQAFIDFLQVHIVARPGVHIMLMNDDLAKSFGPYASHYQIILDFNSHLEFSALERVANLKNEVGDLTDLAAHLDQLKTLQGAIPGMIAAVDAKVSTANAAKAALQQPADLKEVYDKAFDRLVTRPSTLMSQMLLLLRENVGTMIAVADYVSQEAGAIKVAGMDGTSVDPVVNRHLKELVEAMHQNDEAVADLKRRFQALLNGT